MEKPMNALALQPLPRRAGVAREQLRAVGLSVRREALACTGILAMVSTVLVAEELRRPYSSPMHMSPEMLVPAAVVALLLPMAMWKGEGPGRRAYHHAMPVDHGPHAVARTLAGLAWLMAAIAAYAGWLGLVALLTGGRVLTGAGYLWAAPVVGAVVLYLLGSALALRVAHPWRWLGGAAVGYAFLTVLSSNDAPMPVYGTVESVFSGRYGLGTLLSGLSPIPMSEVVPDGGRYTYLAHQAVMGGWMTAVWLWLAIAISLFLWSAYRQPEG
jgi:hypothetical protein